MHTRYWNLRLICFGLAVLGFGPAALRAQVSVASVTITSGTLTTCQSTTPTAVVVLQAPTPLVVTSATLLIKPSGNAVQVPGVIAPGVLNHVTNQFNVSITFPLPLTAGTSALLALNVPSNQGPSSILAGTPLWPTTPTYTVTACPPACTTPTAPTPSGVSDTTPPVLTCLSLSSSAIDVTAGAATLTLQLAVTDNLSGFQVGFVTAFGPGGQELDFGAFGNTSPPTLAGLFTVNATIPQFTASGTWSLQVFLYDEAANSVTLTSSNLQTAGIPYQFTVTSVTDSTPPTVTGISFSPNPANADAAPTITLSLSLADSQSGVMLPLTINSVNNVGISAPNGQTIALYPSAFARTSGTVQNGVWQASFQVPQFSAAGTYSITFLEVRDAAGNRRDETLSSLQLKGLNPSFTVTSSQVDSTPPVLTGLSFSPQFVNAAASQQKVTVQVTTTDDLSGVGGNTFTIDGINVCLYRPSGVLGACTGQNGDFKLVAGTPTNGTWQWTVTIPQFGEQGTWTPTVQLADKIGNSRTYSTSDLSNLGLPTTLFVTSPSDPADGTIGIPGGTVTDQAGTGATFTAVANVMPGTTSIYLQKLTPGPSLPIPSGYTSAGTPYFAVTLSPALSALLPAPGVTLVLPLSGPMTAGTKMGLFSIDPLSGLLTPTPNVFGGFVTGTVDSGGNTATFTGLEKFATLAAMIQGAQLLGDLNGDQSVNCADLQLVKNALNSKKGQPKYDSRADLNGDGVIDIRDLAVETRYLPSGTVCQ